MKENFQRQLKVNYQSAEQLSLSILQGSLIQVNLTLTTHCQLQDQEYQADPQEAEDPLDPAVEHSDKKLQSQVVVVLKWPTPRQTAGSVPLYI